MPTRPSSLAPPGRRGGHDGPVSAEDLEAYENELELSLYREYRDVVSLFSYVVETERRFYLANAVDVQVRGNGEEVFFELTLEDAWVWDIYRTSRFVKSVHVVTFKDVNVEELTKLEMDIPS
nr:DUF2469 domain-containing protein [Actinomyces bowdenii]